MKKKIFSVIMGLVITAGITGCSNNQGTPVENEVQETAAVQEAVDVQDTVDAQESVPEDNQAQSESEWKLDKEIKFDFSANFCGFYNSDCGLTVGREGEIHYSTDKGENWPESTNDSACLYCLDFLDENIVYAAGNAGYVVKSIDGGKTFTCVGYFGEKSPYKSVLLSFADESNGLIGTTNRIGITSDGGATWKELSMEGKPISLLMVSANEFYVINDKSDLLKTEDAGCSWETIALNLPQGNDYIISTCSMAMVKEDTQTMTVYCIQKSEDKTLKSYTTQDGCATWTENVMPEFKGAVAIYPSRNGEVINLYKISDTTITTLVKQ